MRHNDNGEKINVNVTNIEAIQASEIPVDIITAFDLKLKDKKFVLPTDGIITLPFNIRMLAQAFENDLMLTYHKTIEAYFEFNLFTNERPSIGYDVDSIAATVSQTIIAQRSPNILNIIGTSAGKSSIDINCTTYTFEDIYWRDGVSRIIDSFPADFVIAAIRQLIFAKNIK